MFKVGDKVLAAFPTGMPTGETTIASIAKTATGKIFYKLSGSAGNIAEPWLSEDYVFQEIKDTRITLRDTDLENFMDYAPTSLTDRIYREKKGKLSSITLTLDTF